MIGTRVMLRLTLGILCGVALVLIPSVFSAQTPTTSSAIYGPAIIRQSNQSTAQPLPLSSLGFHTTNLAGLSLLVIVLFIFLPSATFSLIIRRWAEKRARDYL